MYVITLHRQLYLHEGHNHSKRAARRKVTQNKHQSALTQMQYGLDFLELKKTASVDICRLTLANLRYSRWRTA